MRATWLQRGLACHVWQDARWRKHRAGGTVWYIDCELAEGYVGLPPESGPKALPAPSAVIKGMPTTH